MKATSWRIILGVGLILMGAVALLQTFGIISPNNNLVGLLFGILFLVGGVAFLTVLFNNRQANWWAVIPGCVLLALGGLVIMGALAPQLAGRFGGPFFLAGISLAFWLVYLLNRNFWWAVIPAGTLATLAVVAALPEIGGAGGGVFFLGLAATFGLVALLPHGDGTRREWAWIPAAVLLVLAVVVMLSAGMMTNLVWPTLLILGGLFLVARSLLKK